jgi:hypothetical protein
MKNKLILIMLLGLFLIGNVMALDSLGTFKQNQTVRITQVCSDATYITISSITYPNSAIIISGVNMTSAGSGEYYYTFNKASVVGRYDVRGISDGCDKTFATYFDITPSGNYGNDNMIWYIVIIFLAYFVGFMGFFGKNVWVSVIGGFSMMILGIYIYTQGVIIYLNWVSNAISAITLALGMLFVTIPLVEYLQEEGDID